MRPPSPWSPWPPWRRDPSVGPTPELFTFFGRPGHDNGCQRLVAAALMLAVEVVAVAPAWAIMQHFKGQKVDGVRVGAGGSTTDQGGGLLAKRFPHINQAA